MSPEEEEKLGITTKFGVQFDPNGKLKMMTKMQICRIIMDANEQLSTLVDDIKGIHHTISSYNDKIQAFNKKLANGKADNQILICHHKDSIDKEIKNVKVEFEKIKNSPRPNATTEDSIEDGFLEILRRDNDLNGGIEEFGSFGDPSLTAKMITERS